MLRTIKLLKPLLIALLVLVIGFGHLSPVSAGWGVRAGNGPEGGLVHASTTGLIHPTTIDSGTFDGSGNPDEEIPTPVPPTPTPPTLTVEQAELETALTSLELARQQGPEAVVALSETLSPVALDLVIDEIVAARELLTEPPPPESNPVSEAEELAILQAQESVEAANRALALTYFGDAAEGQSPNADPQSSILYPAGPAVDRTVGNGCTYATIAAALAAASPGDTLLLEGGRTFAENITLPIALTVQGGYAGCASGSDSRTTLNGNANGPVVIVNQAIVVSMLNLNVTNGNTGIEGGGIRFAQGGGTGTLSLTNVSIYGNTAEWGGGLWVGPDALVNGENVEIYNNTANTFGGGVRLYGGRVNFVNSYIHDNSAPLGGGLYATRESGSAPVVDLIASDLYNNQALSGGGLGGGVYVREGTLSIASDSDLIQNNAIHGGGAYVVTSTLTLAGENSWIYNNTATGSGGGVYAQGSTVYLVDSAQLYNNTAETGGGAYLDASGLYGRKASIRYNTANLRGGGVYATNSSVFDMDLGSYTCLGVRCNRLSNNTATTYYGGGVYVGNNSVTDLRNTFIESNTADYGGGVYAYNSSTVYVYNSLLGRNNAVSSIGDAIRLNLNVTMTGAGNTLANNDAGGAATGQAIGLTTSSLSLHCSIIWGHTSSIDTPGQNVTYSDIQGGYAGVGNLNVDPLFVAPASSDYHLQITSPVIDRCAFFSGMNTDFDNEIRPIVRTTAATPYDMGADEFSTPRVGINGGGCAYGTVNQAIAAAANGDTIQVVAGTIFEAVDITGKNVTVVGGYDSACTTPGAGASILDATYHSGSTVDISNSNVTLRNLRVTGGNAIGGGVDVLSSGYVTLDNTRVTDNTGAYAAGLYVSSSSVVTITNGSQIENNTATSGDGGGAHVSGRLIVNDWSSRIANNRAPNGGGVYIPGGVLELRPGHIRENQATAANGVGGGIYVTNGGVITATASSNVFGNSAYDGAGIYADAARVYLSAVVYGNTATNHGGGIYLGNASHLRTSNAYIGYPSVSGVNQAMNGAGIYAVDSTVNFSGLIQNNLAANAGAGVYSNNSLLHLLDAHVGGTDANQANQLGTSGHTGVGLYLMNNSNTTLNNTVIAGNSFQTTGFTYGGGAYVTSGSVLTLTNSTISQHLAQSVSDGRGAGLYLNNGSATLDNSQIISNTAGTVGGGVRLWGTSTLNVLNGSVIANNHAFNGVGGAIAAGGVPDINISNATLRDNSASTDGGAIYIESGTLDFTGGWTLRQNTAGGNGGAIAVLGTAKSNFRAGGYSFVYFNRALGGHGGMLYLGNNTTSQLYATSGHEMYIYANQASENGGALYADNGGYFDIYGQVHFDRNRADNGGAIFLSNGSRVWLDDYVNVKPQLWDNWADVGSGGAIYAANSPNVRCDGAIFGKDADGNHAAVDGGALYLSGSTLSAENCIFQHNLAANHGGAIAAYTSTLTLRANFGVLTGVAATEMEDRDVLAPHALTATACNPTLELCSAFYNNIADSDANNAGLGGAIYSNDNLLTINHTKLYSNTAYYGGAIFQTGTDAHAQLNNTLIYSNTVNIALGAGIRSSAGVFTMTHVTIANNVGGAGYSQGSSTTSEVRNSIAWGNTAGGFLGTFTVATWNIDQSSNAGLNVDPRFVAPGAGENYRLRNDSPAIDACATGLPTDLDGIPRPVGAAYDMGAFEKYVVDVSVSKAVSGISFEPGQAITFTLNIANDSASDFAATGIILTDTLTLLSDMAFTSNLTVINTGYTPSYVWQVQDLAPGHTGVITVTGLLQVPLTAGVYTNTASIRALLDPHGPNNAASITFTVLNLPPAFTSTPPTAADPGTIYTYDITTADPNGPPLSISATSLPAWLTLTDHGDGSATLSGTPSAANGGDHTITLTVTDGGGLSDTQTFTITVSPTTSTFFIYLPLILK